MQKVESLPHLAEPAEKPVSIEIALRDDWQKGDKSVRQGANRIFTTIVDALNAGRGALIGRNGTIELTMILQMLKGANIDLDRAKILERNAGVFPITPGFLGQWLTAYTEAVLSADVMAAGWYGPLARSEWKFLSEQNAQCFKVPLRSIEPYYCKPVDHWTRALEGKRVTVVSSFAKSMITQLGFRDGVWPFTYETLLPNAEWNFVRSYYSPVLAQGRAEWPYPIKSWVDAIDVLELQVMQTKPQIVLIGCGGLGMILGARLKKKGIVAVVMGGAIQVLFGIRGKRWESHSVISNFWNGDWIKPSDDEVPGAATTVEGGCYW